MSASVSVISGSYRLPAKRMYSRLTWRFLRTKSPLTSSGETVALSRSRFRIWAASISLRCSSMKTLRGTPSSIWAKFLTAS